MDALFGLSMNTIMIVLVVMLAVCLAFVAFVALTNRIVFMMGLRNIPRRTSQTVLIVIGLMLSTVIITAAFATGDTVDYSVTKQTYDLLGHADVLLDGETGTLQPGQQDTNEIPGAGYQRFLDVADGTTFESIDGYAGVLYEPVPVIDTRTGLSEPAVAFAGVDADRLEAFPDIIDASSGEVLDVDNLADDEVYLNETAANELDADVGDPLQTFIFSQPLDLKVTAIVRDTGVAGGGDLAEPQGMVTSLDRLHELFGHDDVSLILVSATGGARPDLAVVDDAALEIEGLIEANNLNLEISDTKRDFVEEAESIGNFMTTFFLLLGLFSIGAGILIILMIFVMLAAERKSEMGMSRAIGMKRGQLVQMFVSEGGAYDIGSAFVGVFIGILVAFALTTAASAIFSTFGFTFTPHVTLRTAVVSFCLGAVLTFLTVAISSWRISNLNIVAAIRDSEEAHPLNPEAGTVRGYLRSVLNAFVALLTFIGPFLYVLRGHNFSRGREERYDERSAPWIPFPVGFIGIGFYQLAMLITRRKPVPTWPFYTIILSPLYLVAIVLTLVTRDRRPAGMPSWLIVLGIGLPLPIGLVIASLQDRSRPISWGPGFWTAGILFGALFVYLGMSSDAAFPFALGITLIIGGVAVVLTYFGANLRASYTTMGLAILLFWGLAAGDRLKDIFGPLNGNIEMFFLSGVAMVTASTFVIIYNADIFMALISRLGNVFGSLLPSLRIAIAYPMANRFRTGMTLAMISLVVFALTTMSAMNLNYDRLFLKDDSRGGWDVVVTENPNNPLTTVRDTLAESDAAAASEIRAEGGVLIAGFESSTEISQDGQEWSDYQVNGLDETFLVNSQIPLDLVARGYDQATVWQELAEDRDIAVIDRFTIESGFGPSEFTLEGIDISATNFDPPTITVRDATTGVDRDVQIIGIISFGASGNFPGVYIGEDAFRETFGEPELTVHYAALEDPDNATQTARDIESALVTTGAQAESLKQIAEENNALSRNFLYLMQAFMGLGLVVGIAAIGVIAFRTVVERRQQIGMLRAIGFKRSQVSLSFLIESSFVTILGVASGSALGLWLAYFLVSGDDFPGDGNTFYVPWLEISVIAFLTITASAFMTLIPARQAASVPTAEALRYE